MSIYKLVLSPGGVSLLVVRRKNGYVLVAHRDAGVIGQTAFRVAMPGSSQRDSRIADAMPGPVPEPSPGNRPVEWCSHCNRYYNPSVPHDCAEYTINPARKALEKYLGTFSILEE